jgi:hypothetical protein
VDLCGDRPQRGSVDDEPVGLVAGTCRPAANAIDGSPLLETAGWAATGGGHRGCELWSDQADRLADVRRAGSKERLRIARIGEERRALREGEPGHHERRLAAALTACAARRLQRERKATDHRGHEHGLNRHKDGALRTGSTLPQSRHSSSPMLAAAYVLALVEGEAE